MNFQDTNHTIKSFIEKQPLYAKSSQLPTYDHEIYPGIIELECRRCNDIRPFHKPGYGHGIALPGIPTTPPKLTLGIHTLEYKCTGCLRDEFLCWIEVNLSENWMRKVGQIPPWSLRPDKIVSKLVSAHQDNYRKAVACESHGYGIAAYAYYRRIVEDVIDQLLDSLADLIEATEREKYADAIAETKKQTVAQAKIALVKELLPSALRPNGINPLSILHQSLSEGIHGKTDEECLEFAQHIRETLAFLADQIEAHRESSKRFTESMRALLDRKRVK